MKKFFAFVITASLLSMMYESMHAQDSQNPWHLIMFENEEEVAFYNTEMITGIEATAESVTVVLDNGKRFSHPTETTTFSFDPREDGTATINESIAAPQWKVNYVNGRLYFSQLVSDVFIYAINGALVSQFTGSFTEGSVQLSSGIYFVKANGKSAKLLVNNGRGSTTVQPDNETKIATPINLRSESIINEYWNITADNSTLSVRMAYVKKFSFSADVSLVFELKNGLEKGLSNYQGVEFTVEPVDPSNVMKIENYQGPSGYVKFNLSNPFTNNAYIEIQERYGETILGVGTDNSAQFYLEKIDDTRYLIRYDDFYSPIWLRDQYVAPALPGVAPVFEHSNIGRFTLVEATRDGMDNLNILGGTVVDLKNPNDYTFTFVYDELSGGYTIYTELTGDLSEYGIEGSSFYMDLNPMNGNLVISGETGSSYSKAAFFIEETEVESPYIDFGDEIYVRIASLNSLIYQSSYLYEDGTSFFSSNTKGISYLGLYNTYEYPDMKDVFKLTKVGESDGKILYTIYSEGEGTGNGGGGYLTDATDLAFNSDRSVKNRDYVWENRARLSFESEPNDNSVFAFRRVELGTDDFMIETATSISIGYYRSFVGIFNGVPVVVQTDIVSLFYNVEIFGLREVPGPE